MNNLYDSIVEEYNSILLRVEKCQNEMLRLQAEMDTLNSIKTELEIIISDSKKENE